MFCSKRDLIIYSRLRLIVNMNLRDCCMSCISDVAPVQSVDETAVSTVETSDGPTFEKVGEFIQQQKKVNTIKATDRDLRKVTDWLYREKFELRALEEIEAPELNELLSQFFIFVKKLDGNEYQPSSLTCVLHSLDRYLKGKKYTWKGSRVDLLKDIVFEDTREALSSKRKHLKTLGLGNRPHRAVGIEEEEEEILWKSKVLGKDSPFAIIFSLWYHMTLLMGLRGRDEHRRMTFGDIQLKKNGLDVEYLEFQERASKTRDGATADDSRSTKPKIFCSCATQGANKCIIEIYKEFVLRRPDDYCKKEDPFYIQSKTDNQIKSSGTAVWFKREPLGVASLGKMLPKACSLAHLPERGNHGVRATSVQRMRKAGIPDDKVIQITGHKSVRTLAIYDKDQLDQNEHRGIQEILQRNHTQFDPVTCVNNKAPMPPVITQAPVPAVAAPHVQNAATLNSMQQTSSRSLFSGAYFNNCVFNITQGVDRVAEQ